MALLTGIALVAGGDADWPLAPAGMAAAASAALAFGTAALTIAAALGGAVRLSPARGLEWGAVFVVVSALAALAALGVQPGMAQRVALSHIVLATAAAAAFGLGRLASAVFRDERDAAAAAALVVVWAGGAVLVVGPNAGFLAPVSVAALLTASPIISVAAAADIDLFHSPVLYQLSPIAHQQFAYPSWYVPAALYLGVAILAWQSAARIQRGFR